MWSQLEFNSFRLCRPWVDPGCRPAGRLCECSRRGCHPPQVSSAAGHKVIDQEFRGSMLKVTRLQDDGAGAAGEDAPRCEGAVQHRECDRDGTLQAAAPDRVSRCISVRWGRPTRQKRLQERWQTIRHKIRGSNTAMAIVHQEQAVGHIPTQSTSRVVRR